MDNDTIGTIDVDGCLIRFADSVTGSRAIVLVHGAGAHRLWWYHVAAQLRGQFRVVSLDLSGHGDSGRRTHYPPKAFAADIIGVVRHLGLRSAALVGHSMGGRVATIAAAEAPNLFSALVLLDSLFTSPRTRMRRPFDRPTRPAPDAESLRRRFRLVPVQPLPPWEQIAPIVDYSMTQTPDGWRWKHEQTALEPVDDVVVNAALEAVRCPITFAYGTESALDGPASAAFVRRIHPDVVVVPIENGQHHLPLDSPAACVEIIRTAASAA